MTGAICGSVHRRGGQKVGYDFLWFCTSLSRNHSRNFILYFPSTSGFIIGKKKNSSLHRKIFSSSAKRCQTVRSETYANIHGNTVYEVKTVCAVLMSLKVNIWWPSSWSLLDKHSFGIVLQTSWRTFKAFLWIFAAFCSILFENDPTLLQ